MHDVIKVKKILSTKEIRKIQRKERSRIHQEIHDEFGHSLTVLKLNLFDLKTLIPHESSSSTDILNKIEHSLNEFIKTVQRIPFDLQPKYLKNQGLEIAIQKFVADLRSIAGKEINLDILLESPVSDEKVSLALFRILQESLTNTFRHTLSQKVDISLRANSRAISMTVRDYGDYSPISYIGRKNNLGINNMRKRALKVGGSFQITYDSGTWVSVNIPLENPLK